MGLDRTYSVFLDPTSLDAGAKNILYSTLSLNKNPLSMWSWCVPSVGRNLTSKTRSTSSRKLRFGGIKIKADNRSREDTYKPPISWTLTLRAFRRVRMALSCQSDLISSSHALRTPMASSTAATVPLPRRALPCWEDTRLPGSTSGRRFCGPSCEST